ncbi:hypothetical protein BCR44DRAFT_1177823 [Catenaria anguillulae PL171]|uniref:Uncharacterized protein n=1 Tax=Catenaria anguillulae PL171 TaxID=765915 RepID=A0A1Y2HJN6_9FUNG|nr:hypothetical protein BCR44DRAFT_1177823 [Catenaria anguillulae PL171]
MARTKRPAAVTSAAATENADTPANLKRHRRSVKAPSKTIEAFVLHDIDEPVPPPTTETLSVDEANIDELAIAFPSTGSNAYLKYHLPEGQAEVEPQLMALLENWEEDEDLAAMQQCVHSLHVGWAADRFLPADGITRIRRLLGTAPKSRTRAFQKR